MEDKRDSAIWFDDYDLPLFFVYDVNIALVVCLQLQFGEGLQVV